VIKIVAVSDTHGQEVKNLPKADLLIHSGDWSCGGSFQDTNKFLIWMSKIRMDYQKVVVVPGNHDKYPYHNQSLAKEEFRKLSIDLLIDEATYFQGKKIYGMPWTPIFFDWAFMADDHKRKAYCEAIPSDTDILITHGAPKGYLDVLAANSSDPGAHAGCEFLKEALDRVKPQLHTWGHLHEGSGIQMLNGTILVNASSMDERYRLINGFKTIYL
jgi:Icc-related predicted phosphoesterase